MFQLFRRKTVLEHYQEKLFKLLYLDLSPDQVKEALLLDPKLKPLYPYIEGIELEMIDVASMLSQKWSREKSNLSKYYFKKIKQK